MYQDEDRAHRKKGGPKSAQTLEIRCERLVRCYQVPRLEKTLSLSFWETGQWVINRLGVSLKRQAHVELEPRSPNLFLNRGRIHILLGNSGQATADLEQVLASTQEERYVLLAKELLGFIQ